MLRAVVLGGSGFVGSAVLRAMEPLAEKQIHVLAHRSPLNAAAGVRVFTGAMTALPKGLLPAEPHVVIHAASKQIDRDGSGFADNLAGVETLAGAVNPHTLGIIYLSSFSVYGDGPQRGIDEAAPLNPQTELAQARAECERRLKLLAYATGIKVACLRSRFVFGRGDRHFLPGVAKLLAKGLAVGSGEQRYSLIDVDDYAAVIVDLARRICRTPERFPAWSAYNVGYSQPVAFNEIAAVLRETLPLPPTRLRLPALGWALSPLPVRPVRALATRLNLLGYDHYGSTTRLAAALDRPLLNGDARDKLRRAASHLAA